MPVSPPTPSVITRFAPSPTGHLHIGGARTALFCWAFAKRAGAASGGGAGGGSFLLRIEDTDVARSSDESARGIMEDMAWLGIHWDEGPTLNYNGSTIGGDPRAVAPFFQAQRLDIYNRHIAQLVEQGKAYPAFETAAELDAKRKAANAAKQTYRYERPGHATSTPPGERLARLKAADASGTPYVVRFVSSGEAVVAHDKVLGDATFPADFVDDFVIRKADGLPTYHFAVVVDDQLMGVTHVLRAQEHLNNTAKHIQLQRALGFRTPEYGHMPLIFNTEGTKMSKRDKAKTARAALQERAKQDPALTPTALAAKLGLDAAAVTGFMAKENDSIEVAAAIGAHLGVSLPEIEVSDFREAGYLPEAINNFLALLGWNPGLKTPDGKDLEKFDMAFLAQNFSLERIGRTNARFDRKKLLSFNGDAIAAMSDDVFATRWLHWLTHEREPALRGHPAAVVACLTDPTRRLWLARAVKARAKTLADALKACDFLSRPDDAQTFDQPSVDKHLLAADRAGAKLLAEFAAIAAALDPFEPTTISNAIEEFAQSKGLGMGQVAQPIRVAVAGVPVSPPLGETLAILGRASVAARINRCLAAIG